MTFLPNQVNYFLKNLFYLCYIVGYFLKKFFCPTRHWCSGCVLNWHKPWPLHWRPSSTRSLDRKTFYQRLFRMYQEHCYWRHWTWCETKYAKGWYFVTCLSNHLNHETWNFVSPANSRIELLTAWFHEFSIPSSSNWTNQEKSRLKIGNRNSWNHGVSSSSIVEMRYSFQRVW